MHDCIVFDPDLNNRVKNYDMCIHLHPQYDEDNAQPGVIALSHSRSTNYLLNCLPYANRVASLGTGL